MSAGCTSTFIDPFISIFQTRDRCRIRACSFRGGSELMNTTLLFSWQFDNCSGAVGALPFTAPVLDRGHSPFVLVNLSASPLSAAYIDPVFIRLSFFLFIFKPHRGSFVVRRFLPRVVKQKSMEKNHQRTFRPECQPIFFFFCGLSHSFISLCCPWNHKVTEAEAETWSRTVKSVWIWFGFPLHPGLQTETLLDWRYGFIQPLSPQPLNLPSLPPEMMPLLFFGGCLLCVCFWAEKVRGKRVNNRFWWSSLRISVPDQRRNEEISTLIPL